MKTFCQNAAMRYSQHFGGRSAREKFLTGSTSLRIALDVLHRLVATAQLDDGVADIFAVDRVSHQLRDLTHRLRRHAEARHLGHADAQAGGRAWISVARQ